MAVRVVAVDSPAQPDDVADAQVIGEDLLDGRAVEAGVARLDFAEQAFLGRQQRAPAVDVDRTPFHHDPDALAPLLDPRHPARQPQPPLELARQAVVAAVVVVLGPAVELPVDQTDGVSDVGRRLVLDDERRRRVAQPDAVGRRLEEPDRVEVDAHGVELVGDPALHRPAADDDVDHLDAAQVADDLGVDPGDRRELAGPVVAVVRPGDPGRRVRLPFGGHAVAERGGLVHGMVGMRSNRLFMRSRSRNRWVIGA